MYLISEIKKYFKLCTYIYFLESMKYTFIFIQNIYQKLQLVYISRIQRISWLISIHFYNNPEISKADISLT